MDDYTARLTERVLNLIEQYEKGLICENGLENFISSTADVTEDKALQVKLRDFCTAINDSLYNFDEKEGKDYLARKISDFKLRI